MRRPLEDKIEVIPDPPKTQTEAGLIIPDNAQEYPNEGTVRAVGDGIPDYPMKLKPGYRVLYSKTVGTPLLIDGVLVLIMRQSDILEYDDLEPEIL